MRLRTFTAPDMPSAMKMVREAMGDQAVILASEKQQGRKGVSVTAAIEARDDAPAKPAKAKVVDTAGMEDLRFEIQNIFRFHNLPELFVAKLMQKAADKDLNSIIALHRISAGSDPAHLYQLALTKLCDAFFGFDPLPLDKKDARIMLVGPPGIGKTLTVAKIAAKVAMEKQPLTVITTDNKRAGGVEQLQAFTNILNLDLQVATTRKQLIECLDSVPARSRVLIDTAGCNPYDAAEMKEIREFAAIENVEPVLVLPAGGDSLETIDAVESFAQMPLKRLMITRADTARRFGGVLAAAAAQDLSFCNVSASSSIIDMLQPLNGGLLAQLLLKYK